MMTYHALMYLACEQIVIRVIQFQKKKWARQPMDILCTEVRQLSIQDLCIGVKRLQLGVRHFPFESLCVGVKRFQLGYSNWNSTTLCGWTLFIGV